MELQWNAVGLIPDFCARSRRGAIMVVTSIVCCLVVVVVFPRRHRPNHSCACLRTGVAHFTLKAIETQLKLLRSFTYCMIRQRNGTRNSVDPTRQCLDHERIGISTPTTTKTPLPPPAIARACHSPLATDFYTSSKTI